MATGSGAYPLKAGFNQSGGGYYICLENLWTGQKLNTLTPGTGSGGATTVGSFAANATHPASPDLNGLSTLFQTNSLIKDMGKTIVSAGRTFRKIQNVQPTADQSSPTFGVGGSPATASNPGYMTYYIEIGRDGANADSGAGGFAKVARYA